MGPQEQLCQHSRQVGRAPLEFGSLPEAVERGEDHTRKQLFNHLSGIPQATSVLPWAPFSTTCKIPSAILPGFVPNPSPGSCICHSVSLGLPTLCKMSCLCPVHGNSPEYSPAQSFHFQ